MRPNEGKPTSIYLDHNVTTPIDPEVREGLFPARHISPCDPGQFFTRQTEASDSDEPREEERTMDLNNVNTQAMGKFVEAVKADPSQAKKSKRVEGEWVFEEGRPQFRAVLTYKEGEQTVEADFAPFMGGRGLAPDPIQYCLYGMASCFAGTFVALASQEGIVLRSLRIAVENKVDLTRTLGLSDNPIVESVEVTLTVETDAPRERVETLEQLAQERCPGIYCLTNPIPLTTRLVVE